MAAKSYIELYNERLSLEQALQPMPDNPTQEQVNAHNQARITIAKLSARIKALEGNPSAYRTNGVMSRLDIARQNADAKRKRRLY